MALLTNAVPVPGLPQTSVNPSPVQYVLYYMEGGNPHTQWTFFNMGNPDFREVVARAKQFCDRTNKRFVRVKPAFVDFSVEEKRHEEI